MNTPDQGVLFQCVVLICFLDYPPVNSQSACGATLMSLTGVIQSPNFSNNYPNGLDCVYVISVPDTYRVTLAFTNFDLENSTGCKYDYVEVRDGDSESSPPLGRYCGRSHPGPLRTSGNRMWIKFVTDSSVTRPGFRANYTSACGATLTSLTGVIHSPNFPNSYTNGLGCVYVISVPDTYRVTLTFTNFDLENSTGCTYDYVEVRDGDSESSSRLGRYCGTSLPGPLRTSSNRMWIKFVTDSSVTRPGFRANYTSACGATLTSLTGVIHSPNFPNNYTNGLGCVYVISVPETNHVTLTFTNFDLENSTGCTYDYVEVRDGDSESSPQLGRCCGTSVPEPLRTSSNRMWIKFVTDSSVTRPGFRANYTSACGATLTSLTAVIYSPNFPNNYTNGLGCVYVISVPDTSHVTLTFTNFDLENSTGCTYDYVEVRDGDSESSPRLGRYCGTSLPEPLRTSSNRMWIKFVTDSSVTRPGFRANYTSACGATLTSLTGVIHSPNFPNSYTNGLGCVYVISVPDTYCVTLTFTNFDLENSTGCTYDYVEVRDGDSESSPPLGRYCGRSHPGPLRTSSNRMWIKFVTDSSVTRPGFRANYTSACGATLTSLTGVIHSPNFPNDYTNGLGCVYVISVPDTYRVTLTFTNFDLENSGGCTYDYVEVRDGDSESSPQLGRYCGTSLPGPLRTSIDRMWIKFVTDSSVTRPGFRANYTSDNGCFGAPCQNGGTCTDHVNGYLCQCAPGYSGLQCQTDIDECVSTPCQNGGTCTDHVNGYLCQCEPGYSGLHCQTDTDECVSAPCQNGGTCTDHVNGYLCQCAPGYSGLHCQTDIAECVSTPCQNGGTCTDHVNGYLCHCAPGYSGLHCQTDIDECVSTPCQNRGTCTDHVNGYLCHCAPGYSGLHCQTDIDECVSAPCQNGGTCTDHINSYLCQCAPGYSGLQCQTDSDIDECTSGPCQNGGTCIDDVNSYTCLCAPGYSGIICNEGTGQSALNVPLISGVAAGVSVVVIVVVVVVVIIVVFMKRRDPQHDKPGKRQNRTSKEPHSDPRTENNQPGETNRACSVSSISARYAELEKPVPVRPPGDTLYCKLEKKKKHADESLYTALGTPCKQAVFTNQAFNENADPDHVYSNVAEENGGYDSSSVHANLESDDDYLRLLNIPPTPPRKPPTIPPR